MTLPYTPQKPPAPRKSYWAYLRDIEWRRAGMGMLIISLALSYYNISPLVFNLVFSAVTLFVMTPVALYIAYKVIPLILGSRPSEMTESELTLVNQGIVQLSSTLSILQQMSNTILLQCPELDEQNTNTGADVTNDPLHSHLKALQGLEADISTQHQHCITHITDNQPSEVRRDKSQIHIHLLRAETLRLQILGTFTDSALNIPPILQTEIDVLPSLAASSK